MIMHTTEQAIAASTDALRAGVADVFIIHCLIADGFEPKKAHTILKWAAQFLRNKAHEQESSVSMVGRRVLR